MKDAKAIKRYIERSEDNKVIKHPPFWFLSLFPIMLLVELFGSLIGIVSLISDLVTKRSITAFTGIVICIVAIIFLIGVLSDAFLDFTENLRYQRNSSNEVEMYYNLDEHMVSSRKREVKTTITKVKTIRRRKNKIIVTGVATVVNPLRGVMEKREVELNTRGLSALDKDVLNSWLLSLKEE